MVTPRTPTVRGIRAILRKAGVPLSEFKSEKKYGPRYRTNGADVYTPATRRGMLLCVIVEWCYGHTQSAKLPDVVRDALAARGYVTDAHGLVRRKEAP